MFAFIAICQPTLFLVLYQWDSSQIRKLHAQEESWPLCDGFALDVKVSYDTRWIFHRFSGSSILLVGSLWVRFAFSLCNTLTSLKSVPCVISPMTLLKVSATLGIVTTRICSTAEISAGSPWGEVDWISNRRRGTEFNLGRRYHYCCSPTLPRKLLYTNIAYSSRVFPHEMDSGNPITTF